MTSVLARRLLLARRPSARILQPRVFSRFASVRLHDVTEHDVASFYSYLESRPTAQQLDAFKKSPRYKAVVEHLKIEGATDADIDTMLQPTSDDPLLNGGYVNPPAVKRSLRDPYEDWWDKQERRNFGEPVHEDNDVLGVFSLHEYNHFSTRQAVTSTLCYIGFIAGIFGIVYLNYPGQQIAPRAFPGGLDVELGGKGAVLAPADEDD